MDRKEYLELCQKVSMLRVGIGGIVENVPRELMVIYDNIAYYPLSYELSYDKGIPQHNVILHGLRSHSIVKANLSKVRNAI